MQSVHALFCLFALLASGCGSEGPPATPAPTLHPVTGTVVNSDGTPFGGAVIQFSAVDNPTWTTMGDVGEDGTFKLQTMHDGNMRDGALAGEHNVTITPLMGDQTQEEMPQPIVLPETVTIDASDENKLELKLP